MSIEMATSWFRRQYRRRAGTSLHDWLWHLYRDSLLSMPWID